ncbi:hypothetical protein PC119_g24051 [Phytophthora cactorum]|nr:hypothetical protein PC114_g19976 [Phytophthora cactorum]KAG2969050.1 hypothetical protein PC119_g24051 [Phytophthora cactorum]KAG3128057.1 hypothetical protein C6341_g24730 [Phytophthora cactorum]KAG3176912.1 hypothetical protein PC128_g17073 [Phytophthora cactorum]
MGAAIEERNLLAGRQTGEAPGCTINDLRLQVQETAIKGAGSGYKSLHDAAVLTLMWHTFGRAIDTCFTRKNQLSMAASRELFLHIARIKTSVVQAISYAFPLVPHAATSDLPGKQTYSQEEAILYLERLEEKDNEVGEPPAKRVRGRPDVSKYINDLITLVSDRLTKVFAPLSPELTPGLLSQSLRHESAAYANVSPQLAIRWISTRGAWLLDSLTKVFAYVGTTTLEEQSAGKC